MFPIFYEQLQFDVAWYFSYAGAATCYIARAYARGGLGLGIKPPMSLIFYKNFITFERTLIVFAYFLLFNLSTYCKYNGMNLHANFKEHCKWAEK